MKTEVHRVKEKKDEKVTIECVELTEDVREILVFIQSKGHEITGMLDGTYTQLLLSDIFYFEALDEHVFAYTKDQVYEIRSRLYEVEERYQDIYFLRISKSIVVNLRKIQTITPALNARFTAHLKNGEQLIVSRQYVKQLKKTLLGGQKNEV
ncbi:LytTR family DNA-binding domain-containing protein [Anaerosporobacter faecicola]|uniref:LytTR family DNA-binding domain-containing protein n=1 Tax=Anaerosporobacter faecicola TaxID=2718714 RepID=UPI00143B7292|nr:LytTR family DNA-binding domain-containing protein [Anaerosporobacter faecicola]